MGSRISSYAVPRQGAAARAPEPEEHAGRPGVRLAWGATDTGRGPARRGGARQQPNAQRRRSAAGMVRQLTPDTGSTATPASASASLAPCSFAPSPEMAESFYSEASSRQDVTPRRVPSRGPAAAEMRLQQARLKSNECMEALRLELRGFGAAVTLRYASWPPGCQLEVWRDAMSSGERPLAARLVRYDAGSNVFEVRLADNSVRVVPAIQVRRVPNPASFSSFSGASSSAVRQGANLRATASRPMSPPLLS